MTIPANYPQEPKWLWNKFYELSQIPRPSKKEEKVVAWLVDMAKENNIKYAVDDVDNVIYYIPGSKGREEEAPLLIQNHIDMVTDAVPGLDIDFDKDPINLLVEDGWVTADRTTLGADNGIGVAAALAAYFDETVSHPPLELLFTTDEETGLNGAKNLKAEMFSAKRMLNLDTEEYGSLYIGCAGGIDYEMEGEFELKERNSSFQAYDIAFESFCGGHSGIDIHLGRANAVKLLSNALTDFPVDFELMSFKGGRAHNIIPRDAFVQLAFDPKHIETVEDYLIDLKEKFLGFLPEQDQEFQVSIGEVKGSDKVVADKERFVNLLTLFPHGAYAYNWQADEPLVNYSSNLAVCHLNDNKFYLQTSVRFTDKNEHLELVQKIKTLAKMFNMKLIEGVGYPSWKPSFNNPLLEQVKNIYKNIHGEMPEVKAIHAGLECGLIKDKLGEMDIVSFGPNILGAHSPTERIEISSTEKFWNLFKAVLKEI